MKIKQYYQQKKNSLLIFEIWCLKGFYSIATSESMDGSAFAKISKVKLEQNPKWLLKQIYHPKIFAIVLPLRHYKAILEYLALFYNSMGPCYIMIENHIYVYFAFLAI